MINIYGINLNDINLEDQTEFIDYKNEETRKQKIASSILISKIFPNRAIVYNDYGKPYLKEKDKYFNVSHTIGRVVMAVNDSEIGVDIEKSKVIEETRLNLLNRKVSKIKLDSNAFLKEWTIKESYLKLIGIGISVDLREIEIDYDNNKVSHNNYQEAYFCTIIDDDYIISVSSFKKEKVKMIND